MAEADLATRIALQEQRVNAVHAADSEFTFALTDYCRFLTGAAGPIEPLQLRVDELSQPHMDRLQVLRDMMLLLEECYDSAGDGEQAQVYVGWATDLIREKFNTVTAEIDEGGGDNGGSDGGSGDGAPPGMQVIDAVSNFWFGELAPHLVAQPELRDIFRELDYLVGFALDPRDRVQPFQGGPAPTPSQLCDRLKTFRKILQTSMIFMDEPGQADTADALRLINNYMEAVGKSELMKRKKAQRSSSGGGGSNSNTGGGGGGGDASNRVWTKLARGPGSKKEGFKFKRSHSGKSVLPRKKKGNSNNNTGKKAGAGTKVEAIADDGAAAAAGAGTGARTGGAAAGGSASPLKTNDLGRSLLNFLSAPAGAGSGGSGGGGGGDGAGAGRIVAGEREGGGGSGGAHASSSSSTRAGAGQGQQPTSSSSDANALVPLGTGGLALPRRALQRVVEFVPTPEAARQSVVCHGELREVLLGEGRERLDLAGLAVPGPALEQLVSRAAPTLRWINLYCADVDGDVVGILGAQPLPRLEHLDLFGANGGGTPATAAGFDVARVARLCLAAPELRSLDLRWNRLTLRQVLSLVQALQGCRKLRSVDLRFNAVAKAALRDVEQRMPQLPFALV